MSNDRIHGKFEERWVTEPIFIRFPIWVVQLLGVKHIDIADDKPNEGEQGDHRGATVGPTTGRFHISVSTLVHAMGFVGMVAMSH